MRGRSPPRPQVFHRSVDSCVVGLCHPASRIRLPLLACGVWRVACGAVGVPASTAWRATHLGWSVPLPAVSSVAGDALRSRPARTVLCVAEIPRLCGGYRLTALGAGHSACLDLRFPLRAFLLVAVVVAALVRCAPCPVGLPVVCVAASTGRDGGAAWLCADGPGSRHSRTVRLR